jgi:hypothetical protein
LFVGHQAPTGRAVEEWAVTIMHFEGDKVVREWIGADKLGFVRSAGGPGRPVAQLTQAIRRSAEPRRQKPGRIDQVELP